MYSLSKDFSFQSSYSPFSIILSPHHLTLFCITLVLFRYRLLIMVIPSFPFLPGHVCPSPLSPPCLSPPLTSQAAAAGSLLIAHISDIYVITYRSHLRYKLDHQKSLPEGSSQVARRGFDADDALRPRMAGERWVALCIEILRAYNSTCLILSISYCLYWIQICINY